MKVLITGGNGALSQELVRALPTGMEAVAPPRSELDISLQHSVHGYIVDSTPDVIINAAAYTAVDKAENDSEAAYLVNATGASNVAMAARDCGCRLIQISTDYVFAGDASAPLQPADKALPCNVYGSSKLAGEEACRDIMPEMDLLILRSGWLYSVYGHNFVKVILDRMLSGQPLRVVDDQKGTPTWSAELAGAIWGFIKQQAHGVHHWSCGGETSWYDFAMAISEIALSNDLVVNDVSIEPVDTATFGSLAPRPQYSVLDCASSQRLLGRSAPYWRDALESMMQELVTLEYADA